MGQPGSLLDVSLLAQLVCLLFLVAPRDVRLLVLPVPGLDEDDVVLADPDALLHLPRDPRRPRHAVHAPYLDPVRAEHVLNDGEDLVLLGHTEVRPPLVVAHAPQFDGETV